MNPSAIPATCSLALTAVLAAGISHWWSVRQFTGMIENGVPVVPVPADIPADMPQALPEALAANPASPTPSVQSFAASSSTEQKEFFAALVQEMKQMKIQNRDLLDQLAETNRDMMKMQFRLDTHSESFRPLPVAEDKPAISLGQPQPGTSIDNRPGVLPPRAEPVRLPSYE